MIVASPNISSPAGLRWDRENYSCAYDALLVVLYDIWSTDMRRWTERFKGINEHHLKSLTLGFKKYTKRQSTLEAVRDSIRHRLYSQNPTQFPYGTRGTSVNILMLQWMTG